MMLEHSETHLLFVGEQAQYLAAIEAILGMEQKVQLVLFDRAIERIGEDKESLYIEDFLRIAEGQGLEVELEKRRELWNLDDTALILYTSGTSGVPKGVQISFRSVQWAITQHSKEIEAVSYTHLDVYKRQGDLTLRLKHHHTSGLPRSLLHQARQYLTLWCYRIPEVSICTSTDRTDG